MSGVLIDTSVFIEFFRGKEIPSFRQLLDSNQVLLSRHVRLELLQGIRKNELPRLEEVLSGIPALPFTQEVHDRAESILKQIKGSGLTVGIMDLLLTAEASLAGCRIYSLDKVFGKLARLKVVSVL